MTILEHQMVILKNLADRHLHFTLDIVLLYMINVNLVWDNSTKNCPGKEQDNTNILLQSANTRIISKGSHLELCYQNIMRAVSSNSFGIIQGFITCHTW